MVAFNECDTNADTCCLGKNFVILRHTNRTADVYAYDTSYAPIEGVPIVSGATLYVDKMTGLSYILIINEALYYGNKLDHSLINPNQIRHFGIDFWDNAFDKTRGLSIEVNDKLKIPMTTMGTKILFETRSPSELELRNYPHIILSSEKPWNPGTVKLGETESIRPVSDPPFYQVRSISKVQRKEFEYLDPTLDEALLHSIEPSLVNLKERMINKISRIPSTNNHYDYDLEELPSRRTYVSHERHSKINENTLYDRFCIGIHRARATLRATTQKGLRSAILPIGRRYRADRVFDVKRLSGKFATDTLWSKTKSLRSNVATQLYSHKCGLKVPYHLLRADGEQVGNSLADFIHEYGAPDHLKFDGAAVQVGPRTKFMEVIRRAYIKWHVTGPKRPNENPTESAIREVKKRWYRIQEKKKIPKRLWDYGITWVCETGNVTVSSSRYANGRTPLEIITGETPDITEYLDFGLYDWVIFKSNAGVGPVELGRWLGVSHRVGQLMSYWVLPSSGIPISCATVQRLTLLDQQTDAWKSRMEDFNNGLEDKLEAVTSNIDLTKSNIDQSYVIDLELEDDDFIQEYRRVIDDVTLNNIDDEHKDEIDPYLNMELGLPRGDDCELHFAQVKRRAIDVDGKPVGRASNNPILDSRQYKVEFLNGEIEILTANLIAENLLAQVDEEGHRQMMIDEIIDHRVLEDAIPFSEGTYVTQTGMKRKKRTTRGWEICVQWKDGSNEWISFKDLKDTYPVELAEYAINNNIQHEPVFAWWVPWVLKKRDSIIAKLKTKYWQRSTKYGIRIPKSVDDAINIDRENKNTVWMDAVRLEMENIRIAFEAYNGEIADLIGYKQITGHLVFDVKLGENFRRKARYCADGHKTDTPASVTYSTVVSRDSVRIILTTAALNGLEVLGADVQNAFLTARCREKVWIKAGSEFGADQGKTLLVVRALYGLKSASASFRAYMAEKLDDLGFKSSQADPDVWMRPAIKSDGEEYYEYVLVYVDDILLISMDARTILQELHFKYKNDMIEEPSSYLGARLKKKKTLDGINCWTITSVDYINAAVETVEAAIKNSSRKLPNRVTTPMLTTYVPELDGTPELDPDGIQFFQELIGMLRWATEIGRVDILLETSLLSQYQASPREGHLQQLLHIFAYLKKKPKLTLYFDPSFPKTKKEDFLEQYRDAEEQMPFDQPRPRGMPVVTTAFVDASHASNKKTRRSHTGYLIFVNRAPIVWYSKRQQTVESSTFSSEFLALRACVEHIEYIRYKLGMFGIPIMEGHATNVFCDNESVVNNSSKVESVLNKKHCSIAYHYVRTCVAAGVVILAWIESALNLADPFTKRLAEETRSFLFGEWTY